MGVTVLGIQHRASLSARRAWIEISIKKRTPAKPFVALRKESVDRNGLWRLLAILILVVALRKESVDRNMGVTVLGIQHRASLSARRAWIEIWWLRCWQLAARGRSPQGERG